MSTSLLATKLYLPPPRPRVVARPRLVALLNEGLHGRLTLVSAPAGFGKTTLVSEWLGASARPAAWLALDDGDSDLTRFLMYVVAAVQTIAPQVGAGVLADLQSPQQPPIESILTALINDITAVPGDFVLVLDDYHSVDAAPVDAVVVFLLEHLPPQLHLVIATREDPPLPLARLRARGQLTEVRAADLRFTPAEAAGFLKEVMGLDLAPEQVAALEIRTEGWIAGLQLAALSMRGRADVGAFVKAFAGDNRYIVDYLVEEVLQRQPARVRSFLLATSILDRLCGPLCDAVTGQGDGVLLLDALERGNLFVVPLDDRRYWFRYHHLFADVLTAHASQEQPAQVPIWHQRASAWYADNGMPAAAVHHALVAKDFAHAAGLIELEWPAMDGRFQSAVWLGWASLLPDALVRARPVLNLAYAWALLNAGELEAAESRMVDLERWLEIGPDIGPASGIVVVDEKQLRTLPASLATARAYLGLARGDLPNAVKYGQRALDLLPADDHLRRGPAAALLSLALWASGDLEAAHSTLAEAMANFQLVGSLHFAISGTYGLADIRVTQGRLRDAVKTYTAVLQLALAQGEPLLRGTADLYLGLGDLYREQGELARAGEHLQRSEELGEHAGLSDWRYRQYRAQAGLKVTEGDLAAALILLDAAERHYRRSPVPDVRPLAALKARVWIAQGQLSNALNWVREQGLSVDDELIYLREFEHITLVRVLLAEYARDPAGEVGARAVLDAMRLLDRLEQAAAAGGRMGSVIEIAVLQALALQMQGANQAQSPPDVALVALQRALTLAAPEGYVRIFVDEGPAMASLLAAAVAQGIMPGYVGKLLAAFSTAAAPVAAAALPGKADLTPAAPAQQLGQPLIEPLSARELEVLGLIAQGLSNEAIGARLFLALSTVKGHNRNIFEKLQVQSRTEAVARARELGLL